MDLVPKTLEDEFQIVTSGDCSQQRSRTQREDNPRKRRLGSASKHSERTEIERELESTESPVPHEHGRIQPQCTEDRDNGAKKPVSFESLSRENSRLRFEVDNAKSLQKVLERNILSLQEQIVAQKSTSPAASNIPRQELKYKPTVIPIKDQAQYSDELSPSSLKALIAEKQEAAHTLEVFYKDRLSKLKLDIDVIQDEKHSLITINANLSAEIERLQNILGALQAERNSLREQVVQLESDGLGSKNPHDISRDTLETNILAERLEKAEAEAARVHELEGKLKEFETVSQKLEAAELRVRCLEKIVKEQDDSHTSFLNAKDELMRWKNLFSHVAKDITPQELFSHMQSLENSLSEYQQQAQRSEIKDVQSLDVASRLDLLNKNAAVLENENLKLRKQIKQIESSNESKFTSQIHALNQQVLTLKEQLGSGYFNDETTKVLHMKRNPYHDQKVERFEAQITRIEAENATLRNRLENLGGSQCGIPAQSELKLAQMDGEIKMLRKKLSEVQKASERLKQVFMRQITLLRESVPKIFGYQLEMVSDPDKRDCKAIFTLSPQSTDSNSKIIFKLLRDGEMELVDNDFTKKFPTEIETFIKKFNSIPGFIANMTLENFQRQS